MELNELYGIIGNAIIIVVDIFAFYCAIKLSKIFYYEIYNNDSKLNKIIEKSSRENHFKRHFKKWLKSEELQKKYSNFYEYYEIKYNKQFICSEAYKDFIKYKENKEQNND